ncbi:MAG: hypothetical protein SOX90_10000, partial [Candidatus Fimadaptatus sp.]|nr:hypothetical protein [Candidatus Fimadaptatus sp.]
ISFILSALLFTFIYTNVSVECTMLFTKFDEFFAGHSGNPGAISYKRRQVMLKQTLDFRSDDFITLYRLRPPHSPRFDAR